MPTPNRIPIEPGTYVIFLHLDKTTTISVGRLGSWEFHQGHYAYVGSAQGPGGLAGRLKRHLRSSKNKKTHWHIDRLASKAPITQIWWQTGNRDQECHWASLIGSIGSITVPRFGASDCRCPGHLIWLPLDSREEYFLHEIRNMLGKNIEFEFVHPQKAIQFGR